MSGPVRIHYLERGRAEAGLPSLLVSAGIWEPAERAIPLFDRLAWHHCVSFSYRGRGRSDTPASGYDLEDHSCDLEAVVEATHIEDVVLLSFSRGVACAIRYALDHPDTVRGLVIGDYPPVQLRWPAGDAKSWKDLVYLGRPITDSIRPEAIDGLEREGRAVDFWDDLSRIQCPVLVQRGLNDDNPIPPGLTAAEAARYLSLLPDGREVGFAQSGHMLADDEPTTYRDVVQRFVDELVGRVEQPVSLP